MTVAPIVMAVVAASSLAAGCHDQPTQVVLVVNSDVLVPSEADSFSVTVVPGPFEPSPGGSLSSTPLLGTFPISLGIVSQGESASFSFVARLLGALNDGNSTIVVSKTVTNVRFVAEQTQMLLLELPRSCVCHGTSCPLPGNPVCDNVTNPALVPFDPALAPATEASPRFAANGTPQ